MDLSPVILAIPMFLTLAVELVYEGITQKKTYRLNDAVTNISTGVLQQLTGTFVVFIKVGIYVVIYEKLAFFHLEANWLSFAAVMVLWDLCYWEHRMAHQISLFWGGHVVHHQSEDYNLSVALRQTSTGFIWGVPFYLPIALLGFDPSKQFVVAGGLNLLYQFWIHTEHINKMPRWFEVVFNTPSHHRVHHGRDPKYIDKNFAGIFIFWDRLFGTFKAEQERPNYGITKPLRSWNPVYANFAHYIDLWRLSQKARSGRDLLGILFRKPGWMPQYLGGYQAPQVVEGDYQKFQTLAPRRRNLYIFIQFLGALALQCALSFQKCFVRPDDQSRLCPVDHRKYADVRLSFRPAHCLVERF